MDDIINLTYQERSLLESVRASSHNAKQFQRAQALLLLDGGESVEGVAELLQVSRQTIYNWIARFEARTEWSVPHRLLDAPRSGRPATAAGIIDPLLDDIMETDPRESGYRSTVWTAELLQHYLADYHQIAVGRRSVRYALERLEIAWKRPRHTLARRSPTWRQAKGG